MELIVNSAFKEGDIIVNKGGKWTCPTRDGLPINRKLARILLRRGNLKKRSGGNGFVIYTYSEGKRWSE